MESAAAENVKSKGDQRLAYLLLGKFRYFQAWKNGLQQMKVQVK